MVLIVQFSNYHPLFLNNVIYRANDLAALAKTQNCQDGSDNHPNPEALVHFRQIAVEKL